MKFNENSVQILIRELVLYFASLVLFPIRTVRVLVWKWHFWLKSTEAKIKEDHETFFK